MLSLDILYQVAIVIAIFAGILLILVLWRLYWVLTDVNDTTTIAKRRAKDLDLWIAQLEDSVNNLSSTIKGFTNSFESAKKIKNKLRSFLESDEKNKKGEEDE